MSAATGEPVEVHAGREAAHEDGERMVARAQGSVNDGGNEATRHVENLEAGVHVRRVNAYRKRGVLSGWIGIDGGNGGPAVKRESRRRRGRAMRFGSANRYVGSHPARPTHRSP